MCLKDGQVNYKVVPVSSHPGPNQKAWLRVDYYTCHQPEALCVCVCVYTHTLLVHTSKNFLAFIGLDHIWKAALAKLSSTQAVLYDIICLCPFRIGSNSTFPTRSRERESLDLHSAPSVRA